MSFIIDPNPEEEPLLDSLINEGDLNDTVAPRTPETDNVYDCTNEEIN